MLPFAIEFPLTLAEALARLREDSSLTVFAGGTDLLIRHKEHGPHLGRVLAVGHLAELGGIAVTVDGGLSIGATISVNALLDDARIVGNPVWRALTHAAAQFASRQVRHLATVGGNIVNASPAADLIPPLLALGATVVLASVEGKRTLPLSEVFTGPGQTVIAPDELLLRVEVPATGARAGSAYERLQVRGALDCAIVGIAAAVSLADDGETIAAARIALGAVAPTPLLVADAGAALAGARADDTEAFAEAARLAQAAASPIDDVRAGAAYRREMIPVLVRRALESAITAARGGSAHGSQPVGVAAEVRNAPGESTRSPYSSRESSDSRQRASDDSQETEGRGASRERHRVALTINGEAHELEVGAADTLADVLRGPLDLRGTNEGCGHGDCGACTVLLDGRPVPACLTLAAACDGATVTTIEGLAAPDGSPHPLQRTFVEHGAVQCGFCTPGVVLAAAALLAREPDADEAAIRRELAGNLCRCTGYAKIVDAVLAAHAESTEVSR